MTATSYTATGLPTDGRTLYVRLWSLINGVWQYSDYTYTAATVIAVAMVSPVNGSTLTASSVTFQWTGTATQFGLWIGSTGVGSSNLATPPGTTATSYTATGLPTDGRTFYVRLWSLISGVWQYRDYTYIAATL
jgi:serine protease